MESKNTMEEDTKLDLSKALDSSNNRDKTMKWIPKEKKSE